MLCEMTCQNKGMGSHIVKHHHITVKEYYDNFIKKPNEEFCNECGKELKFGKLGTGYPKYCSYCAKLIGLQTVWNKYGGSPAKSREVQDKMKSTCLERYGAENVFASDYGKQKIKETCQDKYSVDFYSQSEDFHNKVDFHKIGIDAYNTIIQDIELYKQNNNLILESDLTKQYGYGWFIYYKPKVIYYKGYAFLDQSFEQKAKEYYEFKLHNKSRSFCEQEIIDYIKTFYNKDIITNNRTIIKPYELDIYLPDIKVAIEENDNFWHSEENPFSRIDDYDKYHQAKLDICNKKGIYLLFIQREEWLHNNDSCKSFIKNYIENTKF